MLRVFVTVLQDFPTVAQPVAYYEIFYGAL